MLTNLWRDILDLAQRAPSPHNVQPWKVYITSDASCEVYVDNARTLPKEDTTGSFIISGMVMYLEVMRYAAQTFGQDLRYELVSDAPLTVGNLQLFATVTLRPDASIVPVFDATTIQSRRTSRLSYSPKPLPEADTAALGELARTYGHTYRQTTDRTVINKILDTNISALFHDFNAPDYHDEIVSWFRYTRSSSKQHRDGLDYRCMNIPASEYYIAARFPAILQIPPLKKLFAWRYRKLLGNTSAITWFAGDFWEPDNAVNAGKFLIHYWLELTRRGLYIHPFGNLVTNVEARHAFQQLTCTEKVWFVFREGYSDLPPESYRRPVEAILIEEKP